LLSLLDNLHSRRDFLKIMGMGLGYSALAATLPACSSGGDGGGSGIGIPPPVEPVLPAASQEYSILKRSSFGVHRDALSAAQSMGIDAYLEQQLNYETINDGDLESTIATLFPTTTQSPAQLITGFPDNAGIVAQQMAMATQYRQIFSQRQLYEVMVEFWSDHFNIHLLNGLGPTLKPEDDRQVIRAHALGNFRDLLGASAHSASMLFYLDNFYNLASAPNENYARELLELHTLGVDGGYTEEDVKEVARCFTGWSIRFPGDTSGEYGTFKFVSQVHNNDAKVVLGNTIAAGGSESDGEQVLNILATHPSTARFIATKLCRRFISDNPDTATIDAVAAAFTSSNGDIKNTVRALFSTTAFRETSDLKFSRPTEFLAGMIRALAPDTAYPSDDGQLLFFAQSLLGQLPFFWPTPDGYPDTQDYWANTGGLLNRWRLSFFSYAPNIPTIDVFDINYASLLNGANTIATIVDTLADNILMRPLLSEDRAILIDWLLTLANPGGINVVGANDILPPDIPEQAAPGIAAVLISSAYFQLR
jgi:uncharacterized protein (DUF1800 family)